MRERLALTQRPDENPRFREDSSPRVEVLEIREAVDPDENARVHESKPV